MAAFNFVQRSGQQLAGGGAYITGLMAALAALGHQVTTSAVPLNEAGPVRVIDGLALPSLDAEVVDGAVGLIHHTSALAAADEKPAIQAAERARLPRLRRVVTGSEAVARQLRERYGVPQERIAVIPPGLPDAPRSVGSGGPGCAILSVGALVPRKGHAMLLRALARLFDLDWSLTIVGDERRDPAHAEALQAQAAASGLARRVRFAGSVTETETLWQSADLYALASEWEGYAASTAEALRRGLPVAVTEAAAAEGVSPACAALVPVGDSDQLSKGMRRIIFDRALRSDMSEAAWQAGRGLPGWPQQAARFVEATA